MKRNSAMFYADHIILALRFSDLCISKQVFCFCCPMAFSQFLQIPFLGFFQIGYKTSTVHFFRWYPGNWSFRKMMFLVNHFKAGNRLCSSSFFHIIRIPHNNASCVVSQFALDRYFRFSARPIPSRHGLFFKTRVWFPFGAYFHSFRPLCFWWDIIWR